jgi:hypothetical protein
MIRQVLLVALALALVLASSPAQSKKPKGQRFHAILSGAEEVPPTDTRARGVLQLTVNRDGTEVSFMLNASNIRHVVAAHLHQAPVGEDGQVVAFLYEAGPHTHGYSGGGGGSGKKLRARGVITADDLVGPLQGMSLSTLIDAMKDGSIYVNVHTDDGQDPPDTGPGDFPGGEIRGQVEKGSG